MTARLFDDEAQVSETTLDFTGEVSTYAAKIRIPEAGEYRLEVLASDPSNANMGQVALKVAAK